MPPQRREALIEELAIRLVLATLIPTLAVYDHMVAEASPVETIDLYEHTREHWQGHDRAWETGGRCLCTVPTTTGEFVYEQVISLSTAGTDGHFVCYADSEAAAVLAVKAAKDAIAGVDGVCPMGYGLEQIFRELDYIPTLRDQIEGSKVPEGTRSILNLLMFGASADLMMQGLKVAIEAAAQVRGVREIGAMNFGGTFGRHKFYLHQLLK
jgi:formylmethanofuran--tetrahydromethanopterin N-formyltransferase